MRRIVFKYFIVALLVIGSGALLMNISQKVQQAEREIRSYDRKIADEEEAIRVLKAEWAYLNNPTRLEDIASRGFGLVSPNASDLVSDNYLPESYTDSSIFVPPSKSHRDNSLYHDISYAHSPSEKRPSNIRNTSNNKHMEGR